MNSQRSSLLTDVILCRQDDLSKQPILFHIDKQLSAGGDAISYEAHYKGGKGVLKEFYPIGSHYYLQRNEQGQLVFDSQSVVQKEQFKVEVEAYLAGMQRLKEIKIKRDDQDLENFIPDFEVFRGLLLDGNYADGYYVWNPSSTVTVFEEFCQAFGRQSGGTHGLYLLAKGIRIIRTLTRSIKTLHEEGLVHRDIKPQNFGFSKHSGHILDDTVTLFDVNSIVEVGAQTHLVGTPGYTEPEIGEPAGNLTDIYSIGAVLYHFLFSGQPGYTGQGFDPETFKESNGTECKTLVASLKDDLFFYEGILREKLRALPFMKLFPQEEGQEVETLLVKILSKCLAGRSRRFVCCEDLEKKLDDLVFLLLKYQAPSQMLQYKKWELVDKNKELASRPFEMEQILISYLWNHPLYANALLHRETDKTKKADKSKRKDKKGLRVVIVGFGQPAQKYLELVLQAGQIPGWPINLLIISDDTKAVEEWKKERPALKHFFTLDGLKPPVRESYGSIRWEIIDTDNLKDPERIWGILHNFRALDAQSIFLDLSSEELNEQVARNLEQTAQRWKSKTDIAWISWKLPGEHQILEKNQTTDSSDPSLPGIPIYIQQDNTSLPDIKRLDEFALNIHLLYVNNLAQSFNKVYDDFLNPYNYTSSLRTAFSVKYKLFSLGINMDEQSLDETLEQLRNIKSLPNFTVMRDRLICFEHRRWVAEKACEKWERLEDLSLLRNGKTRLETKVKDKTVQFHCCLVDSQETPRLNKIPATAADWDALSEAKISEMDELDQLSVRIHQMYQRKAHQLEGMNLSENPLLSQLEYYASLNRESYALFIEWKHCIQEIKKGNVDYIPRYTLLKGTFLPSLKGLPDEVQNAAKFQIDSFDQLFYPVIGSVECRDFRSNDASIIDHLDFILSYRQDLCLGIPWKLRGTDSGDITLEMAAATLICAPYVTAYFVDLPDDWYARNKEGWQEDLANLARFMNHKNLRTEIEMVLFIDEQNEQDARNRVEKVFGPRLNNIVCYSNKIGTHSHSLRTWLEERKEKGQTFILEENNSRLFGYLAGAGLYAEYSSYQLDSHHRKFIRLNNCRMFETIPMLPSLSVGDLCILHHALPKAHHQPEYYQEIKMLGDRYFRNPRVWKILCSSIEETLNNSKTHELAFVYKNEGTSNEQLKTYEFLLPIECRDSLQMILKEMILNDLAESSSSLQAHTSEEVLLKVHSRWVLDNFFEFLLRKPHRLFSPRYISVDYNRKLHKLSVIRNNLRVDNVPLNDFEQELSLLEFWESQHYLYGLKIHTDENEKKTASFTMASNKIQELLGNAGRILEVFVYYKLRETGEFDDIVCGFEVEWDEAGAFNEFDIIATKGFQTLVIECKARPNIEANFYYKLHFLGNRLGVRHVPVLVIHTGEKPDTDLSRGNTMQRDSGTSQNIVTIWDDSDIQNIGMILTSILEKR